MVGSVFYGASSTVFNNGFRSRLRRSALALSINRDKFCILKFYDLKLPELFEDIMFEQSFNLDLLVLPDTIYKDAIDLTSRRSVSDKDFFQN